MSTMPEKTEREILASIWRTLEEIKAVFMLANQERLSEIKKDLLKEGSVKLQVYDLCDGIRTTQEIAQSLQKSTDYVNSYLSILRREGLITTTEKEGRQIHEQIF